VHAKATTVPFQTNVTFKNMKSSDTLEARINEHADKLDQFYDGITSCDVLVETPHRHQAHGRPFHVRVHLHLNAPGAEIIVSHDPGVEGAHQDPYVAVRDAFVTAKRRLQDFVDRLRGDVKIHELSRSI
jgi:ribosome-associated translation inhibitor RaiA